MNNEINRQIEMVDLNDAGAAFDAGVELTDLELEAVNGGMMATWKCGREKLTDEWAV
jgi:hypothetical protein